MAALLVTTALAPVASAGKATEVDGEASFLATTYDPPASDNLKDIYVWNRAGFPLRTQGTAATTTDAPALNAVCVGVGQKDMGKNQLRIYGPDQPVFVEFDQARAVGSDLTTNAPFDDNSRVQVVAVRVSGSNADGVVPDNFGDAIDLLNVSADGANVEYYDLGRKNLSSDGTNTYTLSSSAPAGHYTFLAVASSKPDAARSPLNVDSTTNTMDIRRDVTLVGVDAAYKQAGSATASPGPGSQAAFNGLETPRAGYNVSVDVGASDTVGSDAEHVVMVYNEQQFLDSQHTLTANDDDFGSAFDLDSDATLSHNASVGGPTLVVEGDATIDDGASLEGADLSDDVAARQLGYGGFADYIANSAQPDRDEATESILYASVAGVTGASGDATVQLDTTRDWTEGAASNTYRYVVFAKSATDETLVATDTGTFTLQPFNPGAPYGEPMIDPLPDAEGWEDVDGNDRFNFIDVINVLFLIGDEQVEGSPQLQEALDYDGDGDFDFLDVIELLFRLD